jgi:hypothetical protein
MAEFKFFCPQCGQQIQCDTGYSGTQIDCPICKQAIVVPQAPRAASAVQPPVPAKSRALRNALVIAASALVLAGLGLIGWYGYSKFKIRKYPPGLVALWSGEGNANDSVGGNNGTAENISYAAGKVGRAFNFNGANFVQVPDALDLHFTDAMTVEAWVKIRSFRGALPHGMVSKYGGSYLNQASFDFSVEQTTHQPYFIVATTNGAAGVVISSTTITPNQWAHIAGTYDGSTVKIYVNGQLEGTTPWNQPIFPGNNPLVIGCDLQNGSVPYAFFDGLIDEVGLFNRALSASEIHAIYTEQK